MTKVTVIIPTYNRADKLNRAVQSVLEQETEDLEIIVIDDASDNRHHQALEEIKNQDSRISIKSQANNLGVSACRNLGIEEATGDYIIFLDDDDVLLPQMIGRSLLAIEESKADLVSCRTEVEGKELSAGQIRRYNKSDSHHVYSMNEYPAEHLLLCHPQVHSFLIRRDAIGADRFPEQFRYGEDLIFWIKLAGKGLSFEKLDFVGCRYCLHERSASRQAAYRKKLNFYRHILMHFVLSRAARNLCWMKMGILGTINLDFRALVWLVKSLSRPALFARHLKYYLRQVF